MKKKFLKKPSDYPLIAFRINHSEKIEVMKLISELAKLLNKSRAKDEIKFKKNDVFLEALKIGIKVIKETNDKKKY